MVSGALLDQTLPAILERLGRDHARISAVVAKLAKAGDQLESGDDAAPAWAELVACLYFLEHYADRVHHPLEDRTFDVILHKGLTPTERHVVFRNLGQHQDLISRTEKLRDTALAGSRGEEIDEPAFVELLDEYLALQRRHMVFEETHIFPLLLARLDNADWNELQKHARDLIADDILNDAGVSDT